MCKSLQFRGVDLSNSNKVIAIDVGLHSNNELMADGAVMWMCSSKIAKEIVLDPFTDWVSSLAGERPAPSVCKINVSLPELKKFKIETKPALVCMLDTVQTLRGSEYFSSKQLRWHWRSQEYPSRDEYYKKMCGYLGVDGLMPRLSKSTIDVGLVLPFSTYGGAEKVALALAKTLVKHGLRAHIFVVGDFEGDCYDLTNFIRRSHP